MSTFRADSPTGAAPAAALSIVNLAARQRMLSQRLALQILLAERGLEGQLEAAAQTLELFESSHARLLTAGRDAAPEEAQRLQEVYQRQGVDQKVQTFIEACRSNLQALRRPGAQGLPEDSAARVFGALDPVLAALNQATSVFDEIGMRREQRLMTELRAIVTDIQLVAREAKVVSFNAQVIAARAGQAGREFGVVASTPSGISNEVDRLAHKGIALAGRR